MICYQLVIYYLLLTKNSLYFFGYDREDGDDIEGTTAKR